MKKIIFFFLILSFALAVPCHAKEDPKALLYTSDAAKKKYGYIDVKYAFDNYQRTLAFVDFFTNEERKKQAERHALVLEINNLQSSGGNRALIDKKIIEIQRFDKSAKTTLGYARNAAMGEIFKEINETIQKIGKAGSYSKIYDSRLKKKGRNLTEPLVELLNQKYQKTMSERSK